MRVLFILPAERTYFHQGIAVLSAILKENGHQTELLYQIGFQKDRLVKKINTFSPQIIAISAISTQMSLIEQITAFLSRNYHLPVIIGGPHATVCPEEVINLPVVTAVCVGEGERALLKFVQAKENGQDNFQIENLWIKTKKGVIRNPPGKINPKLRLPTPTRLRPV